MFSSEIFLSKLAYLCDLYGIINSVNLKLQKFDGDFISCDKNVNSFIQKLQIISKRLSKKNFSDFIFLRERPGKKVDICDHVEVLISNFKLRFNEKIEIKDWILNPFIKNLNTEDISNVDELIDLRCDRISELNYRTENLFDFWLHQLNKFPNISKIALEKITFYPTTYKCETAFSKLKPNTETG